jgi:hypothetical protein
VAQENGEDNWYCNRCKFLLQRKLNYDFVRCFLCPDLTGILTKVDERRWAHINCLQWNKKNSLNGGLNEKKFLKLKRDGKFSERCSVCRKKQGVYFKCAYKSCKKIFHVRCAIKNNLIDEVPESGYKDSQKDLHINLKDQAYKR